ncbi:MAG: discoidin domain-containing protein [Elusimicrobia bacterium]|nr:discoidin domain-containing protein [Elusimicrobiota bacterium]MBK7575532.1 discoidin domain-containing protein [Elusimicrobiota bacterium]MBK8424223.1 discoidin domain-containing protein [Elusimicrobiota bacterium]MBK9694548.1 discoidin domain-containing protein [Elusimicrobiota bacterium]MBL0359477.1 discoidin domain-containing protein [Elusimicrobiota bacterium]
MTNQLNWPDIRAWGSTEGASLPAAHAVDGDERTRWAGQAIDPQWLAVDFGETRAFDTVRLVWEVAYGKDYLVQVSTDKANWTIVGAVTGGDGGVDEVAVGPQAARYLRVYGLARGTAWGYSLYELDAYGPADPVQETLVGSYGEGTASGEIMGLTNVGAIVAAIQSHRNQILKDGNGNMVIARDKWIAYDYENRPVKVVTAEGSVTEYAYDAEGQRVKVTGAGGTTYFVGTVYEERGTERIRYVHAGGQRVAQVSSAAGTSYFHVDQLGSVSALTNGAGAVTRTMAYTPFGGSFEAGGSGETAWRFTGQRQDDGTGLYYFNARYYDPALGRFITPDTMVQAPYDPQTLNRYTYCRNNPVNLVDPSGNSFSLNRTINRVGKSLKRLNQNMYRTWHGFEIVTDTVGYAFQKKNPGVNINIYVEGDIPFGGAGDGEGEDDGDGGMFPPSLQPQPIFIPLTSMPLLLADSRDWVSDAHAALIPESPRVVDILIMNPMAFYGAYKLSAQIGEESAQWYAERYVAGGNLGHLIGGVASSAWTPDTAGWTAGTLAMGWGAAGWAARTGPIIGWRGGEIVLEKGGNRFFRLNPFGNWRGKTWKEKIPHYHRRPGIGKHRPWEGW